MIPPASPRSTPLTRLAFWPGIVNVIVLWAFIGYCVIDVRHTTGGHFAYVLDDAFIHMAVSKHLAFNGVFGVSPYAFTSANSSILWPLTLAAVFRIFGPNEYAPLLIDLLACSAALLLVNAQLSRLPQFVPSFASSLVTLVFLLFFGLASSMPLVVMCGMEHGFQILFTLAFSIQASRILSQASAPDRKSIAALAVLGVLFAMTRWEAMVIVATVCVLLTLRKYYLGAIVVGILAASPLVVFGLVARHFGCFFLPNSIVLKSVLGGAPQLPYALPMFVVQLAFYKTYHLFMIGVLILETLIAQRLRMPSWSAGSILGVIYVTGTVVFFQTAYLPGVHFPLNAHRYDASLVALGLLSIAILFSELVSVSTSRWRPGLRFRAAAAGLVCAVAGIVAFSGRVVPDTSLLTLAAKNIYDQQCQMAWFLKTYYDRQGVGLNDIGACDYYADLHLTDMAGLANMDIAHARLENRFNATTFGQIAAKRHMRVAILFDAWFPRAQLPPNWIRVGQLKILRNVTCTQDTVTFYAVSPFEARELTRHLNDYRGRLPLDDTLTVSSQDHAAGSSQDRQETVSLLPNVPPRSHKLTVQPFSASTRISFASK